MTQPRTWRDYFLQGAIMLVIVAAVLVALDLVTDVPWVTIGAILVAVYVAAALATASRIRHDK